MANRDIVVIGGSAGAIPPLRTILNALPPDLPAAILIVLHVPANSTGIFTAIASSNSAMPVVTAEDGMQVDRGQIYIAPPNRHLLILGDRLKLGNGPRENLARPAIDPLFRSAALSAGPRVVGLILSGMLNDGAAGLAAIKQCGGRALVQAPNTASAAEMPISALEATPVDLSAGPDGLAAALIRFVEEGAGPATPPPLELRLEVEIAAGAASSTEMIEKIAKPVALTCPDCGGVLSEIEDGVPIRFRCQVGHAFTGKALLARQEGAVDEAMRVALRIIEERAELVARMGRDAGETGREGMSEMYAERAKEYRGYADILRDAIIRGMESQPDFPDDAELAQREVQSGTKARR